MAKIIISEKDLTRPDNIEENNNVVYVPGYSLMGPENTPTLCRTINEFESIFGKMPYKFKGNKVINSVKIASDGEYEKSFIYAHELLSLGLPILFTRFVNTTGSTNKKAIITSNALENKKLVTITAKQYGEFGNKIHCVFKPNATYSTATEKVYDFSEYLGDKPAKLSTTLISFNPASIYYFDNSKYEYIDFSLDKFTESQTLILEETTYDLAGGADDFDLTAFYKYIGTEANYEYIKDKNSCKVKFITSGSYPTITYNTTLIDVEKATETMINVAAERGDVTAIIDFDNKKIDNNWITSLSALEIFDSNEKSKYATAFMPWGLYKISSLKDSNNNNLKSILPGSFAYLSCLGSSIKTNADWYAIAGVTRGYVSNLIQLENPVSGAISEELQITGVDSKSNGININTILDIKPYGYCIWGNRTLNKNQNGLIASSFLNIRTLTNDIKKLVYITAKKLTFEQNSNMLWLNFRAAIEPTLDKIVSDNGLADYKIIKLTTTKRATIACKIRLVAIEAVEDWDITIELADSYTTVE